MLLLSPKLAPAEHLSFPTSYCIMRHSRRRQATLLGPGGFLKACVVGAAWHLQVLGALLIAK